jgi:phosphatidate phosphatase APP1
MPRINCSELEFSNLKRDEFIQFFTTSAWYDQNLDAWHVPIHAWVYEPENSIVRKKAIQVALRLKYQLIADKSTQNNFDSRVNLLLADNERGKTLVINIDKQVIVLPKTDARGHVKTIVSIPNKIAFEDKHKRKHLIKYSVVMKEGDSRKFVGHSLLVPPNGISVISDIDDTVKVSHVTNRKRLMKKTFYSDFEVVSGMSDLYDTLVKNDITIHFVSSSPWHLYGPLEDFLLRNGFPPHAISLKTIRIKDSSILNLFKDGDVTKPQQIEPILKRFKNRRFILIGDSGEKDPEVYTTMLEKNPEQIAAIFIRNVTNATMKDKRFQIIVNKVGLHKFILFDNSQEIIEKLKIMHML